LAGARIIRDAGDGLLSRASYLAARQWMLKTSQRVIQAFILSGLFRLLLSVIVLFSLEMVPLTNAHHIARLFIAR
jgi:hypothetical protein